MADKSQCSSCCQFWSETNKRCTVSRNGLFIPLESHIITHCTTEKHVTCSVYREEKRLSRNRRKPVLFNRRRHPRVSSEYSINLRYLHDTGSGIQHTSGMADTVNISAGGMQIRTRKPLFNDTIIRFSYGRTAPTSRKEGIARVTWCTYQKDIMKYRVGLRFHKDPAPVASPLPHLQSGKH